MTLEENEPGESVVHTPGPWTVDSGTLIRAGDVTLTRTAEAYTELKDGARFWETRANARLMAAAPDLLAACEAALNDRMYKEWPAVADLLKAAIAKARGDA